MKIVVENYKEIDLVKKAINEQCDAVLADAQKVFAEKQINVLNQIDEYLLGIVQQLKGTKTHRGYDWQFHDGTDSYSKNRDGLYEGGVKVEFRDDVPYILRINLDSRFGSENSYYFKIVDGKLISTEYTESSTVQKQADEYAQKLIKNWKKLKQTIHDGILKDFADAQKVINDKLNHAQELDALYDNFEV